MFTCLTTVAGILFKNDLWTKRPIYSCCSAIRQEPFRCICLYVPSNFLSESSSNGALHSFLGQITSFCGKTLLLWCDFHPHPPPHMANLTFPFLPVLVGVDAICTLKCHHSPSQSHCCACSSGVHLWGGGNGVLLCWRIGGWRDEKHGNPDYCTELGDHTLFIGLSTEAAVWSSIPCDAHTRTSPRMTSHSCPVEMLCIFCSPLLLFALVTLGKT